MTANTAFPISQKSQQGIIAFNKQCYGLLEQQWNMRSHMRAIDLAYIREADLTENQRKAKAANAYGDTDRLQNLTVPVVMPAVESAVTYQTSVFLQGIPLFGVTASPAFMDAAKQMEAVIDSQAVQGGWTREFILFFRDAFKYNFAPLEVSWDRTVVPSFETDVGFSAKQARPKEIIWEGNTVKRWCPYNTIFDGRVCPADIPEKGEFIGKTEMMSRIALKDFVNKLPEKIVDNIKEAFESGLGSGGTGTTFYLPEINPNALANFDKNKYIGTNWLEWAGVTGADTGKIRYKDMYEVTTLYARIIPSDFSIAVPARNTPQVWKFIIINNSVVIYAERQTNAHNLLPVLVAQPLEDGLAYQTKSLAANVQPIQDISSGLMNSVIASRRRAISDRGIYDPSRISEAHINSPNPSAKIPVRPAAYGKNIAESYYSIPYKDDQSVEIIRQIPMFQRFADIITGQNPARQGQFVKGNKTQHEFDTVMNNANGRDQVTAILLETQIFAKLKMMLKSNILQYQGAGQVLSRESNQMVTVDPVQLRKAIMEFKVSDGLTPSDKLINADTLSVALQQIGTSPQIGAGYNIAPLFSYLMKTQGADLKEFEKPPAQIAFEQAMSQWQQMCLEMVKVNKEMKPEMFPPMPVPEQFGWNPQAALASQQAPQ